MARKKRGKTVKIGFGSSPKEQAAVVHMFDAMLGRDRRATCETYGGIAPSAQDKHVQRNARCSCPVEAVEAVEDAPRVEPSDGPVAA